MKEDRILILDFGGQYNQLIARRVRELHVYCEVMPWDTSLDEIKAFEPTGLIFTGGPNSVYLDSSPHVDPAVFEMGLPILGICYGCQLMAYQLGGSVTPAQDDKAREYGKTPTKFKTDSRLFEGLDEESITWMSHGDYMDKVPEGFEITGSSAACPNAAISCEDKGFYGVQFHPEVNHTQQGRQILKNFVYGICGCGESWTMADYKETIVGEMKDKVGDGKVLMALSGGVDSSVAAALLAEAAGSNLYCVFVDHGLLRKNEAKLVQEAFADRGLNLITVDAEDRFLRRLDGVTEPEQKRKIIGEEFIRVFEEEAKNIGAVDYFAQGTIYPDVIESGRGPAQVIKSHHNVGGLPENIEFKELLEPLRMLFKDEVRALGRELGLPRALIERQPFPGPGLGIRVIGEITKDKLDILREADYIFRDEIEKADLKESMNQYFAVLTNTRTVGVMGDGRTYDYAVALRSVTTEDFMTAEWTRIPYDVLDKVSVRIINEVKGVSRVLYDITSKPPATVEWE